MLLEEQSIIREQDQQSLQLIASCNECSAMGGQLAAMLRMSHHAPLNTQVGRLGKRFVAFLNIQPLGSGMEMNITGGKCHLLDIARQKAFFYWQLRPELQETMRELALNEDPSFVEQETSEEERRQV